VVGIAAFKHFWPLRAISLTDLEVLRATLIELVVHFARSHLAIFSSIARNRCQIACFDRTRPGLQLTGSTASKNQFSAVAPISLDE
jgi:hypothetical protein